jgi:hypothetical protein
VSAERLPDYASLHPGYDPLCCPTGKTHNHRVNPRTPKYSPLQKFGFVAFSGHLIPSQRGVSRSSRNAGIRTVDRGCPAGTRSSLRPLTEEGGTVQSSGAMSREDADVRLRVGERLSRERRLNDGVVRAMRQPRSRAPDAAQRFFSGALQSRDPCHSVRAASWVPALRCACPGHERLPKAPSISSQIATRACKKS